MTPVPSGRCPFEHFHARDANDLRDERAVAAGGTAVFWFVVRGEQPPRGRAVEPGPHGIDIPDDVLEWAEGHGLHEQDPGVYLLVVPADDADTEDVVGEIAFRRAVMEPRNAELLHGVLARHDDAGRE
jgi:hypothetical protein